MTLFDDGNALLLRTRNNTYYMMFEPGKADFGDNILLESDATFSIFRAEDGILYVGGKMCEAVPTGHSWRI